MHGQRPTSDTLRLNGVYPCLAYSICGMHTYKTRGDNTTHDQMRRWDPRDTTRDHSINPRNSRDAVQHTYKTRGSSSLVVQECKSDIK
jgi:hypothetical protein